MATVTFEQTRRSYVDPRNNYPRSRARGFAAHVRTYRAFVRYTIIFAAHVAVILALMAYFLA